MNEDLSVGYDVLVWIDDDGDVVCCGYSADGERFLRSIHDPYRNGDILEIFSHPEEFKYQIPTDVRVGLVNSTHGNVVPMDGPRLQ